MKASFILLLVSLTLNVTAQDYYTYKPGSYDGIGKWYMGREISYVMGYQGIQWLLRPEREKEERTNLLIENMQIGSSDVIADIGAGAGVHVFKMAAIATKGEVYAVDIQQEMLNEINKTIRSNNIKNVRTVRGSAKSVNLPPGVLDKVLLVDVYHEFEFPREMMISIRESLKVNGKVYLIEYRKEDRTVPIKELHKMTEEQAIKEMRAAGFELVENKANLPWQHCMIFQKI
jgi:ubiquinone/menaquinone biosynthesis C-methylase UbiE